jgi:hypothetical protein
MVKNKKKGSDTDSVMRLVEVDNQLSIYKASPDHLAKLTTQEIKKYLADAHNLAKALLDTIVKSHIDES